MKRVTLIGFAVVVAACWSMAALAAQPVHFRICNEDADNFPYLVRGGVGRDNLQLESAAKKAGIVLTQVALPWKRCFKELQEGAVDGVAAASFSEERASFAQYPLTKSGDLDVSLRLRNDSYSLFRVRNSPARWDGKKFTHLTQPVGAQLGYSVANDLRNAGVGVDASFYDAKHLMGQLAVGHLQMAAMLTKEGDALMARSEFAGKIERLSPVFVEKPYFVIFGKQFFAKHRQSVELFWQAIAGERDNEPVLTVNKR